ncbi:MAG: S-layer homology domain-containing protein [Candidatus Altimarinota bacterium]
MKNLGKSAGLFLAGMFLLMPLAQAAGGFSDLNENHPNYDAIVELKERGIIGGYPDGTFKPDQVVNRVEALKILLKAAEIDVPMDGAMGLAGFSDVDSSQWYAPYLRAALSRGIVSGYPDGTFRPTQTVNLVENLKMLMLARGVNMSSIIVPENPYADAFKDQWYAKYVQYAKDRKLIDADADNKVYPGQGMTRGKLAETAYRLAYMQENNLEWFAPQSEQPDEMVLNVSIQDMEFKLAEMTIPVGSTVKWTNADSMNHDVQSIGSNTLNSPLLENGDSYSYTFNEEGTFDYMCSLHPSMKGKIIVKPAHQVPTI